MTVAESRLRNWEWNRMKKDYFQDTIGTVGKKDQRSDYALPELLCLFKPKLADVKVISIYEKLEELGIGNKNLIPEKVFLPCPDREKRELLKMIERYTAGGLTPVENVQCCGLGGCASVKEPELAKGMGAALKDAGERKVYSYCASCAGNLNRNGCKNVTHILTEIMETYEKADIGKSMVNRIKTKFM